MFALTIAAPLTATAQCLPPACLQVASEAALNAAIAQVNTGNASQIVFTADVTLTSPLTLPIDTTIGSVVIDGGGFTLSGGGLYQGFTVTKSLSNLNTATIQNLTIANTVAAGGAGGIGTGGGAGGGGAGLGGALFVDSFAIVAVNNVNVASSRAIGGAGGGAVGPPGADGGGLNGGGGGGAGGVLTISDASPGSFGGGGGGAPGGTGPVGGAGGFGGGAGGSTDTTVALGGFGGGSNNGTTAGGGGAGMGGAVFVRSGGALIIGGAFTVNGNSVTGGAGGTGANAGGAFGSGIFLNTAVLQVTSASTVTITDDIAGNGGSIDKSGGGTLVLGGNNTYTGTTAVHAGVVSISSNANLGTGIVELDNGTTLAVTQSGTYTRNVEMSGQATFNVSSGQTATWNGRLSDHIDFPPVGTLNVTGGGTLVLGNSGNVYSGGTVITGNSTVSVVDDIYLGDPAGAVTLGDAASGGTLAITPGTSFISTRSFTLGAGGGTIDTAATVDAILAGAIGGSGNLTKSGAGALTLSGANTYTGATFVNAGTLLAGATNVFGAAPALTIASGASVDFGGFSQSLNTLSGSGALTLSGGAPLTIGATNATSLFSGTISGNGGITKTGTGTFTLSGNNTFSGGVDVISGTVAAGTNGLGTGTTFVSDGATLALLNGSTFSNAMQLSLNPFVSVASGSTATWNGVISESSPGTLNVNGGGTLVLGNTTNSYTGGTTVTGGSTLSVSSDGALGASSGGLALGNATSAGTLAITTTGAFSSNRAVTLGAGGGTIDTAASTNATFGGIFAGSGSLTKAGAGSLTLSGANTYSGGTFVSGGTLFAGGANAFGSSPALTIGSGATVDLNGYSQTLTSLAGAGTVALSNGAVMSLGGSNLDLTFGGTINGTGGLVKNGTATLTLLGGNSYSGGTTVNGGTLAGNAASLQGNILNNAAVLFDQSPAGTYAGSMSGTGSLTKIGAGTLTLSGTNTYSGGTLVSAGTLIGNAASLQGSIVDNSALVFDQSGAGTFTGSISGTGSVTKAGSGTLTLGGNNTYAGLTTASAGTLRLGSSNALGRGGLSIAGGATFDLNGFNVTLGSITGNGTLALGGGGRVTFGAGNLSFGGSLTGNGGVIKDGSGTLTLTGTNSYTGGTTVSGGTLLGNAGSLQGNILNNAAVVFDQGGAGTYAGSMSGTGSLEKAGAGTLTLSGTNTYTGGTLISGGTLVGNASSLQGTIVNNSALVIDQSGAGTFNGIILGTGTMRKDGAGTLVINGANPFRGSLSVGGGTLQLNGSFAGNVNIGAPATLRGAGVVGGSLNVDGLLSVPAPGTPLASFNAQRLSTTAAAIDVPSLFIGGNLTMNPGSVLDFALTPNGAAPVVVGGTANLQGTRLNVTINDRPTARETSYLGVTTGGGLTTSALSLSSGVAGIDPVVKSNATEMVITLLNKNIPLGPVATDFNGSAVGNAIDRIKGNGNPDFDTVVRELTALDDHSLSNALLNLAGELHATELRASMNEGTAVTDLVRDVISDRDHDGDDAPRPVGRPSLRAWFQLSGDHATYSSNDVLTGTANAGGGGGGFDFHPSERFTLGGGGSFSRVGLSLTSFGGNSAMQAPRAFGYGGMKWGPFNFHGGGSGARSTSTTTRPIQFKATVPSPDGEQPLSSGVDRTATADQIAIIRDAWTELQDTFKRKDWVYDWKIGWRRSTLDRDPFTETGAGSISLAGLAQTLTTKEANVNVHVFRKRGNWKPNILINYRREFADNQTSSDVQFAGEPNGDFIVNGVPIPVHEFHGIFGLTMRTASGLEYTLEYETRQLKDESHNGVHFRVRFR